MAPPTGGCGLWGSSVVFIGVVLQWLLQTQDLVQGQVRALHLGLLAVFPKHGR
jgi:hypothetical protein